MSPVEQTSTHQRHSDFSFNAACTRFERFSKTCSRVRENSGALPHDHDFRNSDKSGYNETQTVAGLFEKPPRWQLIESAGSKVQPVQRQGVAFLWPSVSATTIRMDVAEVTSNEPQGKVLGQIFRNVIPTQ